MSNKKPKSLKKFMDLPEGPKPRLKVARYFIEDDGITEVNHDGVVWQLGCYYGGDYFRREKPAGNA